MPDTPPDLTSHLEGTPLPELIARALFESPEGVCLADPRGRIRFANVSMERMLGYERGELLGVHVSRLHPRGADRPVLRQLMETLQTGGWSGELELLHKQRHTVLTAGIVMPVFDEAHALAGYVCTVRDIRESKRVEREMQLRSRELQALFDVASTLCGAGPFDQQAARVLAEVVTIAEADFARLRVPDNGEQGLRLVASIGDAAAARAPAAVCPYGESRSGEVFRHGEAIIANDDDAARRAGPRPVEDVPGPSRARSSIWLPIRSTGRTVGVISVSTLKADHFTPERIRLLTAIADALGPALERARLEEEGRRREQERAQASEQLQVAEQQLIQSGKLAAIGLLAAGVAHEINNPLNSVMGFTQLLLEQDLPVPVHRDLEQIYAEGQRAARIVADLLAFATSRKPEHEAVDVHAAVSRAYALKSYDLQRHSIELRMRVPTSLPPILGDEQQIIEVVLNLITNAEQAIAAAKRTGTVTVTVTGEASSASVRISVHDDGPGMAPEILGRIFEPFFTTKDAGVGTGLGLSVCRSIVRQHQGEIWAESIPGAGTTFYVELPVPVTPPTRASRPIAERPSLPGLRILVVDDEANARDLTARILERDGHIVETASDGNEAGERIRSGAYDCVVADVRMPGLSGPELYRLAEEINPELAARFIFVTGDTMSPETLEFLSSTASAHLMKPIDAGELRQLVAEIGTDAGSRT